MGTKNTKICFNKTAHEKEKGAPKRSHNCFVTNRGAQSMQASARKIANRRNALFKATRHFECLWAFSYKIKQTVCCTPKRAPDLALSMPTTSTGASPEDEPKQCCLNTTNKAHCWAMATDMGTCTANSKTWHVYWKPHEWVHVPKTTQNGTCTGTARIGTCTENGAKWYMYRNCKLRQENKLAKNTELVHVPDLKLVWRKIP